MFMQNNQQSFGVLVANLISYLERLNYKQRTIEGYRYRLRHLSKMLPEGDETIYDQEAWETIVSKVEENKIWTVSEYYKHVLLYAANAVFELHNTGSLEIHHKTRRNSRYPDDLLSPKIAEYLKVIKGKGYQDHTIYEHRTHLVKFQEYLASGQIDVESVSRADVLGFINSLSGYSEQIRYRVICCLRVFLRYLHDVSVLETDLSIFIPKLRINTNERIPSIYTTEEIHQILNSINIASPVGKRDFAILLLIARLGLRASDVSILEFSNLDWQQNIISITQMKTGKRLQLPLLPDVGNAIVNYLKYGRPESPSSRVFLQARPKFEPLNHAAVSNIFQNLARKGGVLAKPGRKHGSHAFRHSLVHELLSKSVPFPIVTQILGHKGGNTTLNNYARIDLNNLVKCSLDVPAIAEGGLK
jgi:site-specific recombinase XerD